MKRGQWTRSELRARKNSALANYQNVDHFSMTRHGGVFEIVDASFEYKPAHWVLMRNDQVLLKLIAPERHFHGLYIPDSAKRQAYELWQGEVLAVGPGEFSKRGVRKPCGVKPGDRVMFYSVGGRTATRWPTKEHVILSETYIQAVLEAD